MNILRWKPPSREFLKSIRYLNNTKQWRCTYTSPWVLSHSCCHASNEEYNELTCYTHGTRLSNLDGIHIVSWKKQINEIYEWINEKRCHEIFLEKFSFYGAGEKGLRWLRDYLFARKYCFRWMLLWMSFRELFYILCYFGCMWMIRVIFFRNLPSLCLLIAR